MTTVTKTVKFDAAHVLSGHAGLCSNLHGHTYRVDVAVAGEGEMIVDFGELKRVVAEKILDRFDHAFICNEGAEAEREIAAVAERHGMRVARIPCRSTVENLSRYFFGELSPFVSGLASVTVWETADNCGRFEGLKGDKI